MFLQHGSSVKTGKKIIDNLIFFPETGMLDCNQYVIRDARSGELSLFDAGNAISLNALIEGMKRVDLDFQDITKVFLTHEHVDHVLGLYKLMDLIKSTPPQIYAFGECARILEEGDVSKIFPGDLGISPSMFGIQINSLKIHEMKANEVVKPTSTFKFQILPTPGHSLGSICYYDTEKKVLIPGDLVFTGGSFGRYDFPGGSLSKLIESIGIVSQLDVKYLLPGHMNISDQGNSQIQLSYRMIKSIGSYY
jgi:hydroxyacylglutathione hydrolase